MAQALLTAVGIGILGLVGAAIVGLIGHDVTLHIQLGFFSSIVSLLAHSMMMFYLIGKGKAVKDALKEGGHPETSEPYRTFVSRISTARRPVFSIGSLAMVVTMIAAIMGAGVDTKVLPPIVHAMLAYAGIATNAAAMKTEVEALSASSRVVDEVNRLLGA